MLMRRSGMNNAQNTLIYDSLSKSSGLNGHPAVPSMASPMPDRTLPSSADPLGEALHFLRMSGTLYCRSEFTAPWGLDLPPLRDCLMFHIVAAGECWLEVEGASPTRLQTGSFALVPHGRGHRLASEPGAASIGLFDAPTEHISDRYDAIRFGGGGAPATLVCGAVTFDHPAAADLVRLLPPVITIDAWRAPELEWVQTTLGFIAAEAREPRAGGETVITRLADILVIQAVRAWLDRDAGARTGWLGALRDPQIGRVIRRIHREPGQAWSVAAMAHMAGMSRSAFAARFTALVGEPAMKYVARWRMNVASTALREGRVTIAALAEQLGYESEAAFSRAFKRTIGEWPGAVRRRGPASIQPQATECVPPAHTAD
jgi:AraC-like DNA-binding protein